MPRVPTTVSVYLKHCISVTFAFVGVVMIRGLPNLRQQPADFVGKDQGQPPFSRAYRGRVFPMPLIGCQALVAPPLTADRWSAVHHMAQPLTAD